MKAYGVLFWTVGAVVLCCGKSSAELLGSPNPAIRQNFNQLITANSCPGCDLSGAVLNRLDLSGANLEGANLTGAQLNLSSLAGANLRKAVLRGTGLGGASLTKADLRGADMTGALLGGADFTDALVDDAAGTPRAANLPDLFGPHSPLPAAGSPQQVFDPFAAAAPSAEKQQACASPASGPARQVDSIPVIESKPLPQKAAGIWDSFNFFLGKEERNSVPAGGGQQPLNQSAEDSPAAAEPGGLKTGAGRTKSASEQNDGSGQQQVQTNKLLNDVCCELPTQCQAEFLALSGR